MSWQSINRVWIWLGTTWIDIDVTNPLDFPNSPTPNQVFGPFTWSSVKTRWNFS